MYVLEYSKKSMKASFREYEVYQNECIIDEGLAIHLSISVRATAFLFIFNITIRHFCSTGVLFGQRKREINLIQQQNSGNFIELKCI